MKIKYISTILYKVKLSGMPSSFVGVRIVGNSSKGLGLICFPVFSRPNRRATMRYLDKFYTTSSLDKPLLLRKEQIVGQYSEKELAAIKVFEKRTPRVKHAPKASHITKERIEQYQQERAIAREKDLEDFYKGKHNRFERSWKKVYHGGGFTPR